MKLSPSTVVDGTVLAEPDPIVCSRAKCSSSIPITMKGSR